MKKRTIEKYNAMKLLYGWLSRNIIQPIIREMCHYLLYELTHNVEIMTQAISCAETSCYVIEKMNDVHILSNRKDLIMFALKNVNIDGYYLEFGVYEGKTINFISDQTEQIIHGFDSFKGLPETWRSGFYKGCFCKEDGKLPVVNNNVKLHIGLFKDTLPKFIQEAKKPIAFMHVDCDLYSSTKDIFDILGDRIQKGTVILFDEYFNYPGWKNCEFKAFHEFVDNYKIEYEYLGYYSRRTQVAIKIIGII